MRRFSRLIVVLAILLSAAALTPYVAFPSERIAWQLFAQVYEEPASLSVSPDNTQPGTYILATGNNFSVNSPATVIVNGQTLSPTIPTDAAGALTFQLDTTNASTGTYVVTAVTGPKSAADSFLLTGTPITGTPATGVIIVDVPAGIGFTRFVHLPILLRQ
jgi:hypothetical protein